MKEVTFIRQNLDKWRSYETVAESPALSTPDEMADAYIDVTSDLAFSQTHYPQSRITLYLNNLASAIHQNIYRNKRERWSRIITFWTQEMPFIMWDARKELRLSFVIFLISALIGVLSQWLDPDFSRLVMGNRYVEMTLNNIENGTPMAVYDGGSEGLKYRCGVHGFCIGTAYQFRNGIDIAAEWGHVGGLSDFLCPAWTAMGVGFGYLAARHYRDIGYHRGWCRRARHGQRVAVSRHLLPIIFVQTWCQAWIEDRDWHGAAILCGWFH